MIIHLIVYSYTVDMEAFAINADQIFGNNKTAAIFAEMYFIFYQNIVFFLQIDTTTIYKDSFYRVISATHMVD